MDFDINKLRVACRMAANTLKLSCGLVRPGMATSEINTIVHRDTLERGGYPAPLNYRGFPKSVCVSVNNVACHGIPSDHHTLYPGDIVNIDVTTIYKGHFGDCSMTVHVGHAADPVQTHLISVTSAAMWAGIDQVKPGAMLSAIGAAIHDVADKNQMTVIREFGGHGLGTRFHTSPHVNHFRHTSPDDVVLVPGMAFTIEPMLCLGQPEVVLDADGWTVRTSDGSWSAQHEHTVLVTGDGVEVLTQPDEERK